MLAYAMLVLAAWLVVGFAVVVVFGSMCRLGSSRCSGAVGHSEAGAGNRPHNNTQKSKRAGREPGSQFPSATMKKGITICQL